MMNGISWQEYFEVLSLLVVLYYSTVLMLYFRGDILQLARQGLRKSIKKPPISQLDAPSSTIENNHTLFSSVHELMEELKLLFEAAAQKPLQKQELLIALQLKLGEYNQLKETPFQVAVNNHIMEQSLTQCDIPINDIDIKQIW